LPDYCQRFDSGDESAESGVSQLGDSLRRPGRLLYPSSQPVAGKDPRGWRPSAGRTPVPATGQAATLAPVSPARTSDGKSQACHHRQAPADSLVRAHSLGPSGGSDPDPTSVPYQAPAVGLQWTGLGNSHQRPSFVIVNQKNAKGRFFLNLRLPKFKPE